MANISTTGEPLEHFPLLEAIVHIPAATGSFIWLDDPLTNYVIGNQIVGVHHISLLKTKRTYPGLPK